MSTTDQIKKVYNRIGHKYNQDRSNWSSSRYLNQLLQLLPKNSKILDLGCGNGIPITQKLTQKGHLVTGVDLSQQQLQLAQQNCPQAKFEQLDISQLTPNQYQVDAIVCYYTLFHLPRQSHLKLLKIFNSFLEPGGILLLTMGEKEFEGWHQFYGEKIWSSHFGPKKNTSLVSQSGFEILLDEIDRSNREEHQVILARKI